MKKVLSTLLLIACMYQPFVVYAEAQRYFKFNGNKIPVETMMLLYNEQYAEALKRKRVTGIGLTIAGIISTVLGAALLPAGMIMSSVAHHEPPTHSSDYSDPYNEHGSRNFEHPRSASDTSNSDSDRAIAMIVLGSLFVSAGPVLLATEIPFWVMAMRDEKLRRKFLYYREFRAALESLKGKRIDEALSVLTPTYDETHASEGSVKYRWLFGVQVQKAYVYSCEVEIETNSDAIIENIYTADKTIYTLTDATASEKIKHPQPGPQKSSACISLTEWVNFGSSQ